MILLLVTGLAAQSQSPTELPERLQGVIYQEEWAVELKAHTAGIAIGYYKGEIQTYYRTTYKRLEFGYIRHPKEFRQNVQNSGSGLNIFVPGSNYVYGKQNSFLYLKAGIGQKYYLSEKAKRRGVALGLSYEAGPTLGILKPYYLDVSVQRDGSIGSTIQELRYSESNADEFLDRSAIFGHSGFFRGLDEPSFVIGGHAKAAVHLAPGAYTGFVRALEVGVVVDAFTRRVPIMIIENNRFIFVNVYLSVHLGKRS